MRNFILWVSSPVIAILFCTSVTAQVRLPEDKIDPAFQFVMSQPPNARQIPQSFSPVFKTVPMKVSVSPGLPAEDRYDCIVYTSDVAALRNRGVLVNSVLPNFVTAWATLDQIQQLSKLSTVNYIAAPVMDHLHNDIAVASTGASLLHQGKLNNTVYKGKGVIIAIFDTGIDWTHPDFRDPTDSTKSRILRIWDQTISPVAGEVSPTGMGYGVEYTQEQINDELDGSPTGYVRESDIVGHGSHVAGTAAGNGAALPITRKYTGMAPEADIVIIKGGNGSFSTTNSINALTYLKNLATTLGKPIVLNMSLGGQFGPHDGTRDYEVAIDNFTASAPGRAVVISAGNDNGTNIHNRLSLADSATGTVSINVPAITTGTDVFEYRVYLNDNSNITATFSAPSGESVTAHAERSASDSVLGKNFKAYISNLTEAGNGDRYVDVYVARIGSNTTSPAGTWTLSLTNNTPNTLTLDGWLYYYNTAFVSAIPTLAGGNSDYLVGSPGNATTAITVAAFVGKPSWYSYAYPGAFLGTTAKMDNIATFSSHGPRRDGVMKPEIAAIGQHVISVFSSASTAIASDIIIPRLYRKNQGTSMSAPVVTGAVALLLQANPSATVTQLRTNLFSNTDKDPLTEAPGATPNTIWGYGRLDVYKAAAALFNCAPADRKTYQYDASNITSQDAGTTLSVARAAVRFTPDISGQLAGAYFHTSLTKTALDMEVRTDSAGVPGTLLGTVNLPDTTIGLYSWNYVDFSNLHIPVTTDSSYFVVVHRSATSSANWSLRLDVTSVDNRSLFSSNGINWTNPGYDYKIRSVVYSNPQLTGNLATANTAISRNMATTNLFIDSSCQLIAQLTPAGASAVTGSVNARVWIEQGIPHDCSNPVVARHYQIMPDANAATATGRVTLYFTQAEFSAFNADRNSNPNLPANATDSTGKANLRIVKYDGTSGDNSGLPCTYSGKMTIIDPADSDIVWNAYANRWEVSFNVTGFGGFFAQTSPKTLPLLVQNFSGLLRGNANILNWIVNCLHNLPIFDIETSRDGINFSSIGKTKAWDACNHIFQFKNPWPQKGKNYYRIKITDNDSVRYSDTILLETGKTTLYPNIVEKGQNIQVVYTENEGTLLIKDATGRQVYSRVLINGPQSFTIPATVSGVYFYSIQNSKGIQASGKLIVK
jgi:subtilisin family serine protease